MYSACKLNKQGDNVVILPFQFEILRCSMSRLQRCISMAKRSYPTSEVRGSGLECQAATVQEWPRGATPRPSSGVVAGRSYPTSEVRGGGQEELSHF